MVKWYMEIKKRILNFFIEFLDKFIDKNIKELFIDLYYYKNNKTNFILFIIFLPFTIVFLILNLFFFLFFLIFYILSFLIFLIQIRILKKKKKKILKFKKRFKFLKNMYLVITEKMILTFPRKKAYLFFYIIVKKIIKKENDSIEKDLIINWIKAISNRYIIIFFLGIPYIVLHCNNRLIQTINNLKGFTFESNLAFVNTIIVNIYKNTIPDYAKLVEKLKIIINKKEIKFNSYKEFLKASKNKPIFKENFISLKKETIYGSVKNKTSNILFSKNHPTIILKPNLKNIDINNKENVKVIYSNETSQEKLKIWKFMKDIEKEGRIKSEKEYIKNNFKHGGSLNCKKETYYTDPIETEINNLIIGNPFKDPALIKDVKEENSNKALANLTINLKKEVIKTEKNEKNEFILTKDEKEENFLTWIKTNKEKINNKSFEALMEINKFWEESEEIIKNLSKENKIKLAEMLGVGLDEFENPKEINFKIFINFLSKDLKN